jgi:hypothetical protein
MAYATPRTWVSGDVLTAAQMNQDVRDNVSFLANPPACRVYNSASIVVANTTWTALTFDTERYDTAAMHSTASNTSRLTAPVAGLYLITGHIAWGNNAVGERLVAIRHNDATDIANVSLFGTAGSTSSLMKTVSTVWKMAASDYVELRVYQSAGGSLTVLFTTALSPEFSMTWIGLG